MTSVKELHDWLEKARPGDDVGIDEGGLTLQVVRDDRMTGEYYKIGGIPEKIENAGVIEAEDETEAGDLINQWKLLYVRYGEDRGLLSLTSGLLLASACDTQSFSVPGDIPRVEISDVAMTELCGDEHSWEDVIDLLQDHYNWDKKSLPTIKEIKAINREKETKRNHWEEVPGHPVKDWRAEVANNDTRLGYLEWVEHRYEASPDEYCRTCFEPYDGCGDGYDGECPSCADKTAASLPEEDQ